MFGDSEFQPESPEITFSRRNFRYPLVFFEHSNVNREALGRGSNAKIVRDFNQIHRANEFEVLLLKGAKYEGGELAVVHRSPPIEKEKTTRVLLKIDEWNRT